MQVVPLKLLTPYKAKEFTLDLVKNTNPNDPQNRKHRGKLVVEMTFNPFKEDSQRFSGPLDGYVRKESEVKRITEDAPLCRGAEDASLCIGAEDDASLCRGGLLLVMVQGAEDVEGKNHNNPYALIIFRGEQRKTKVNIFFHIILLVV